mmetsp:Transcript_38137/g.99014  ORF Transcript_38137/g.99014 Transcript_38137/m.99014 type:complete len:235 (-) Transcript_38137:41-745(-)
MARPSSGEQDGLCPSREAGSRSVELSMRLRCTDSGLRGLHAHLNQSRRVTVFLQSFEKALSEFQPDVVLVSWQPMGQDWTAAIRATPSVAEYILIGEIDDGICGQPWATWGHHPPGICWGDSSSSSSSSGEIHGQNEAEANSTDGDATSPSISAGEKMQGMGTLGKRRRSAERDWRAPFEADNFVRQELCHLRALQLCRTDECWLSQRHSHTVSFRRQDQGRVDEEHWQSIPVQ